MIILDGGTGTLVQALGAPMNGDTWCADANLTHPEIVRQAHREYLDAGAEVLIANTYATSPLLFNYIGRDDDVGHDRRRRSAVGARGQRRVGARRRLVLRDASRRARHRSQ